MLRKSLFRFTPAFMEIFMPALSPSMESGNLVKWNAGIGSKITQGTSICSIQTDKAVVSFDHQMDDGFLAKTFAKEGDVVEVGKLIAILAEEEGDIAQADTFKPKPGSLPGDKPNDSPSPTPAAVDASPAVASPTHAATVELKTTFSTLADAIAASGPAVARIAREVGEDHLKSLKPTGKGGRFTKGDVIGLEAIVSQTKPVASNEVSVAPKAKPAAVVLSPGKVYDFTVTDANILAKLFAASQPAKAKC